MRNNKSSLLELIDEKLANAKSEQGASPQSTVRTAHGSKRRSNPATRAESNRLNAQKSTGPRTPEGKAQISANALKTGFFASVEKLNPQDSPSYQTALDDMRLGLKPDGPAEEQLVRDLAMFRVRLLRLEAAEYALICASIETNPGDAREITAALVNNSEALEKLQKAETHLRRASNRTWDRLERMQKTRLKMPLDEALKQTQIHATYEAIRTTCPKCAEAAGKDALEIAKSKMLPRHPALGKGPGETRSNSSSVLPNQTLDEKGKLIVYPKGHPMHRAKDDE